VKDIAKHLPVVFGEIWKNASCNKQLSHASTYERRASSKFDWISPMTEKDKPEKADT